MRTLVILLFMGLLYAGANAQSGDNLLIDLMQTRPKQFNHILEKKDSFELQIIYIQIDRDADNRPAFKTYRYNTDRERYFYPASTVKMPVAFLALEKLNDINNQRIDRNTAMLTDSAYSGQTSVLTDSTAENGLPSIGHYIKKIFIVSDNDAYNRLYEFLGPGEIRSKLLKKGLSDARIVHRLSIPLSEDENRHTNPVSFIDNGKVVYKQPAEFYNGPMDLKQGIKKGIGYIRGDELIHDPMEFGTKNFIPLDELTGILQRIIFPDVYEPSEQFQLKQADLDFVRKCMSQLPSETDYPKYDKEEYYDAYSKFLMYGSDSAATIPAHIRIFNKIGLAYGYATDVAYIVDFKNNIEFILSATIHTNKNRIYNDGVYEYDEIAFPFLRDLGELIYDHEISRKREHLPDLDNFRFNYIEQQ